jgi:hypothetical protein
MFYFGFLYKENFTRGACYGDLPFHLNIISSFAYGCNSVRTSLFDLTSPFFANQTLAYPVIPNFYSAVLLRCFNTNYHTCLVLPSFVAAFSLFVILARLVHEFCADSTAISLAPLLFLLSGGLGFFNWFDPKIRSEFYVDFVHHWGGDRYEYWFQTVIHILMPQRASLFSLPMAWAIILMLGITASDLPWFCCIGALVGLLPQVQPHSIVACAQYGVVHAFLTFPWRGAWLRPIGNYAALAVVAISIGAWQLAPFLHRLGDSFVQVCPLWAAEKGHKRNFLSLWAYGLGLFFVLAIFVGPFTLRQRQLVLYAPSLVVFAVANFVLYQPWHLDNTKVFNAWWIPLALAVVSQIIAKVRRFNLLPAIALTAVCVASGGLAVSGAIAHAFPIWKDVRRARAIAEFVRVASPPKSVWITDSDHTHPVVTMAGRQTLAGYPGWLVSHGLDDSARTAAIGKLAANPESVGWADMWGAAFVCVTEGGKIGFKPMSDSRNWKLLWDNPPYRVWQRVNQTTVKKRP